MNKDHGTKIDFKKIADFENGEDKGPALDMYVPWIPDKSKSGPTIGTGIDLGQQSKKELEKLTFPGLNDAEKTALLKKLEPYFGLQKQAACNYVAKNPLSISEKEANALTTAVKKPNIERAKKLWNDGSPEKKFHELEPEQQTVILSRTYQEGKGWTTRETLKPFLDAAKEGDWETAASVYQDGNAGYPQRFLLEYNLLDKANLRAAEAKEAAAAKATTK